MVSVCLSSSPSHPALHAQLDQEAGSPGRTRLLGFSPGQHVYLPQRGAMSVCAVVKPSCRFLSRGSEMAPEFEAERWQQVHKDKCCCCAWVLSG